SQENGKLAAKQRRQPRSHVASAATLPYDAGESGLAECLKAIGIARPLRHHSTEAAVAWLPTVAGLPVASSPLIAEPPEQNAKLTLSPWQITALALSTIEAVDLLCACIGQQTLALGIVIGKDLAFWASALRF